MPTPVEALRVLIASPGDLDEDRDLVEKILHGWNDDGMEATGFVLVPMRWETGSVAILGEGSAQSVINSQLVDKSDIVIALFYSKLGSPTEVAVSGTAEEIERSVAAGKPVHLYFSLRPLDNRVDTKQLGLLRKFKTRMRKQGLVLDFKDDLNLTRHVQKAIALDVSQLLERRAANESSLDNVVDGFIDTKLILHDQYNGRKEISESLQHVSDPDELKVRSDVDTLKRPLLIPSRYHYSSETAADLWLSRSKDQGPRSNQRRTNDFWAGAGGKRFTDFVQKQIAPATTLNLISLGPGDGRKDASMASNWMNAGISLNYFPYDASHKLAVETVNHVDTHTSASKNARILLTQRPVIADFRHLGRVYKMFRRPGVSNIISVLGNLGNLDNDVAFIRDLQHIMNPEDILLLEVRVKTKMTVRELAPQASLRHDFSPLEHYLAMDWGTYGSGVKAEFAEDRSEIDGTRTLVTTYTGKVPEFVGTQLATLQYIHFYDPTLFISKVKEIGFSVLHHELGTGGTFLECLLQCDPPR